MNYDLQGRIVSLKGDADRIWGESFEKRFTYKANGDFRYAYLENGVQDYYEDTRVINTIRHPELLLARHGLPFDLFNSTPWREYVYEELAGYDVDAAGETTLSRSVQTSQTTTNNHQFSTSQRLEENGKSRIVTFTLADCN